jgi:hypothetical protein
MFATIFLVWVASDLRTPHLRLCGIFAAILAAADAFHSVSEQ